MKTKSCKIASFLIIGGLVCWSSFVTGAATDLANGPLASGVTSATTVRPNVAFIVDDSGSMDDQNMPDDDGTNKTKKCWGYYYYNTLAYNPAVTYKPPYNPSGAVYSDGVTRSPDASFSAALKDGYFTLNGYTFAGTSNSNSAVDLGVVSNLPTSATTKYYYTYPSNSSDSGNTTCLADSKYTAVTSSASIGAPGTTAGSAAAKTNYANWFSYYRKRAFMMKASTAEAFSDLSDQYRVGLFFIASPESGAQTAGPNNDLKIADFSGTQRTSFFSKILRYRSAGWTPLRAALARIGRMYAGKISGWDPVQYSCQQNFTILSTDGYWNTEYETSTYGPYGLDGNPVGNVDGGATPAVAATATIAIGSASGNSPCYYVTSIQVDGVDLLAATPVPTTCTTNRDTLGTSLATAINNKTGTTGFTASYATNSDVLTITAPVSLGGVTSLPSINAVRVSGSGSRVFSVSAFSGYVAGSTGATLPYRDALNKSNTLADVAYYYYSTDLRTPDLSNCSNTIDGVTYNNLCENNVFGSGKDQNSQQHMTTFTIGLGASGTILYEKNYETAPKDTDNSTTQYYDIKNGTANWPDPIANSGAERIDDLWHAAVNGRGTYYSAGNSTTLVDGIRSALSGVNKRIGSSSAAATSNLEPVAGDNFVYVALYRTMAWDGDLRSYTMDPDTGAISTAVNWSTQAQLDTQVYTAASGTDGRSIKYFNSTETTKLKDFTYANLTADGKNGYFDNFCSKIPTPDQCGTDTDDIPSAKVPLANDGTRLVNYLRGRTVNEIRDENSDRLYRAREHVLGDIVNAVPVYLKKPPFTYDKFDSTYADFKTNQAVRAGTVFVAANDGMLHAINSDTGAERWAYVPSFVMSNLWQLADRAYTNNHRYFVDGSPTVADVCSSSTAAGCATVGNWKSIVVGGLNKGGCGYYALDVTDPTNPKGLWEFSNANLGYSFGNPIVTRRKDGRWVVVFASGYNNVNGNGCSSSSGSSDGNGHVFVLDALTGTLLDDIPTYITGTTPAGDSTTPSGLAKLNAWIDNGNLNIASRIYGGDLLGNLWRVDFDDNYNASGKEAMRLARLVTGAGVAQPVTIKPELNTVKENGVYYNVVTVGTGRYLGTSDPSDTTQNTIYAFKDVLGASGISNVRGSSMVGRSLAQTTSSTGKNIRTVSGGSFSWALNDGWYIDLNPSNLSPGERINNDMQLFFNMLVVPSNVPDTNVCNVGGYAWVYYVDLNTGRNLSTASFGMIGERLSSNELVAGIKTVKLSNGKTVTIVTGTGGSMQGIENPGGTGQTKLWRTIWREIQD